MKNNEILRIYGTEYKEMTKRLLCEAALKDLIGKDMRIGIKPNLMSCIPADMGATTHPEVVSGIIEYLQENGFSDITIMEGSWVGDKTTDSFDICGFYALSDKYGVKLLDTQTEDFFVRGDGDDAVKICKCVACVDFLINVPVIKGHCQTNITCALKNLKGLIPNVEKRRFHSMGLHKPIALLNSKIKQDFIVVDHICGDLDSEGGMNPYYSNCVMVAKDPVLLDSYVCKLLGYELTDVPYIGYAEKLGVGCADLNTLSMHTIDGDGIERDENLPITHKIFKLKDRAEDVDTCSACYESLMEALSDLEDEGLLEQFNHKILIGQGNRGKCGEYGIGNCTKAFTHCILGCPPDRDDIYNGIKTWIKTGDSPRVFPCPKLVAADLDGTALLDGKLSKVNKDAIQNAIDRGVEFAVCTGRGLFTIPKDFNEIKGLTYAITSNGACIYNIVTGELLRHFALSAKDTKELVEISKAFETALEIFVDGSAYVDQVYYDDPEAYGMPKKLVGYIRSSRNPVPDIYEFINEHLGKIENFAFVTKGEEVHENVMNEVQKKCPDTLVVGSEPQWVEIMHKESGKGKGVKHLAEYLGIDLKDTAAIGDGDNDIEMLEYAGHPIAMGNASQGCKKVAKYVTKDVKEDGLAYYLNTYC